VTGPIQNGFKCPVWRRIGGVGGSRVVADSGEILLSLLGARNYAPEPALRPAPPADYVAFRGSGALTMVELDRIWLLV
jgi:hypothetical protein